MHFLITPPPPNFINDPGLFFTKEEKKSHLWSFAWFIQGNLGLKLYISSDLYYI